VVALAERTVEHEEGAARRLGGVGGLLADLALELGHAPLQLEGEGVGVVGGLAAGERTPVFRIRRPFPVFSWYLRLPGGSAAPWSGVARIECGGDLTAAAAITLADLAQVTLVRYASAEYKDARAPQNLYPIAGLERELRRRLGEPALLYRALRAAAA